MAAFNILEINSVICPRCHSKTSAEAEFRFGFTNQDRYKMGETLEWGGKGKGHKQPENGNYTGEGYIQCEVCNKDFWIKIKIEQDIIKGFEVDSAKPGYIK